MKFDQNGKRKLLNYSSFLGFEIMEYFAFKLQFLSHKQFQSVPTLNRIWTDLLFDFEKKKNAVQNRILISFRMAQFSNWMWNSMWKRWNEICLKHETCRWITWIDVIRPECAIILFIFPRQLFLSMFRKFHV